MKKRTELCILFVMFTIFIILFAGGCTKNEKEEVTEVNVFVAASLNSAMADIVSEYEKEHENVRIIINADSSGTLMEQIKNGFSCDIFFSAASKQMNELEEGGFLKEGTRQDVLKNTLVVITGRESGTKVTGLKDIGNAESIALADGSVPAGKYTRNAMIAIGLLDDTEDASAITTKEISEKLGGVEISEQSNVSKVLTAVSFGSCECGTTYYSDVCGYEDKVRILEFVDEEYTGKIIYPAARIINEEADEKVTGAADEFYEFMLSERAEEVYEKYLFITD